VKCVYVGVHTVAVVLFHLVYFHTVEVVPSDSEENIWGCWSGVFTGRIPFQSVSQQCQDSEEMQEGHLIISIAVTHQSRVPLCMWHTRVLM